MYKGIDVSRWQGPIDWDAVKQTDVEFVILKSGGSDAGLYVDPTFEHNYKECKRLGIPVGCYYFVGSKCTSAADGLADAKQFLGIIRDKQFEYPVYLDYEAPSPANKQGNTDAAIAFCQHVQDAGYYVGIYASDISGFADRLDLSRLEGYDKWVARYPDTPKYVPSWGIHQYSSTGSVLGIQGNVDMNTAIQDYPMIIKNAGLNGFAKPQPVPTPEPTPVPSPTIDWESKYKALVGITMDLVTTVDKIKEIIK